MERLRWSRYLIERLIFRWQQNDILYNMRHKDFRNKQKINGTLANILAELQKVNKDITLEAVKRKMHTLCMHYVKECRFLKYNTGTNYSPRLWCFNKLKFLENNCNIRSSKSSLDQNSNFHKSEDEIFCYEEPRKTTRQDKYGDDSQTKKTTKSSTILLRNKIKNLKRLLKNRATTTNRYDWLAEQFLYKINKIQDETIQAETIKSVGQLLQMNESNKEELLTQTDAMENSARKQEKGHNEKKDSSLEELQNTVNSFKEVFKSIIELKYIDLAKEVAAEISNIDDRLVRENMAWNVQCILQENLEKDIRLREEGDLDLQSQ